MTSKEAKTRVHGYLLFKRRFWITVTECLRNSDVVGIAGNQEWTEVEIKVAKADMRKEFAAIREVLDFQIFTDDREKGSDAPWQGWKQSHAKTLKHRDYLLKMPDYNTVPNEFYFGVTADLVDECISTIKELGLPYGVLSIAEKPRLGTGVKIAHPAKKLHQNSLDDRRIRSVMRRASIENYRLNGGSFFGTEPMSEKQVKEKKAGATYDYEW